MRPFPSLSEFDIDLHVRPNLSRGGVALGLEPLLREFGTDPILIRVARSRAPYTFKHPEPGRPTAAKNHESKRCSGLDQNNAYNVAALQIAMGRR